MISSIAHRILSIENFMRLQALRQFWVHGLQLQKDEEQAHLHRFVKPGDVCLDIGANLGVYAVHLARLVQPAGAVHAFEAMPPTFKGLTLTHRLYRLKQLRLHQLAIGAKPGTVNLAMPQRNGLPSHGRSHVALSKASLEGVATEPVQMTTIDQFVDDLNMTQLNFIKMDIEGFELAALQGGAKTLKSFKPTLLLEIVPEQTAAFGYEPATLLSLLGSYGYQQGFYCQNGALKTWHASSSQVSEWPAHNYFFVHDQQT